MRVVHILNSLKYSGAEIMYVDSAALFQKNGCELSVIATANDLGEFAPKFQESGYEVFHKPYPLRKNFISRIVYLMKFTSFLKKNNIDIVHIHSNKMMIGMAFSSWLSGKKSVYTAHNVFPTRTVTRPFHIGMRWISKNLFKCKFQTISDSVYENELKVFKNKTIKINNWYGSNRFSSGNTEEKLRFRKELGIDNNTFVIISVGGCSSIKRHSDIIKGIALIKKEIPDVMYLHLGEGESEQEEKELVEQLNLRDNVMFVGNQNEVRNYLIAADIYVMSSRFEGIPITTIEAMACNIPTILYDVPGLRDFNNTVITTTLIKEDYHLLAHELINFYSNKSEYVDRAKTAKIFVDKNFNMETNSQKIFELYQPISLNSDL